MISKKKLVERILTQLEKELGLLNEAAVAAHAAAIHDESKAEDHHDTRGLEASYLASAQAIRIQELEQLISKLRVLPLREFKPTDFIEVGALVELDLNGKRFLYFLLNQCGGVSLPMEGRVVQVITPLAPLGEAMLDKKAGDSVEVEIQGSIREYEVLGIF